MKTYWLTFGNTDPRTYAGLAPTFIQFFDKLGHTLAPPGITTVFAGSGAYQFNYSVGYSTSIYFLVDGATSGMGADIRYIRGVLDPISTTDLLIGYTGSDFGSTSSDPGDVFGYVKRLQEFNEGVQTFSKSSGTWDVFSRGASSLLVQKVLTNSVSGVTAL